MIATGNSGCAKPVFVLYCAQWPFFGRRQDDREKGDMAGECAQDMDRNGGASSAADRGGVRPSLENCSLEQGWRELAEGKLDAVHGFVGTPAEGLVNLSQQLPCNVLRYTQEELEQILGANKVYCAAVIPAESYAGQVEEVPTALAYTVPRARGQARDTLKEEHPALAVLQEEGFLWEGLPVALHEGAERFYQENCPGFEK